MMCEAMKQLLWKRFVHEVKPAISNDVTTSSCGERRKLMKSPLKQYLVAVFCPRSLINSKEG